jgi:DNA-binding transcriptional LysR family regulator
MPRDNYHELIAFIAVARERSFTRAAAQLGVSQSALSHTVRNLESRLGIRLLTRTTRSFSPTDAGLKLLDGVAPKLEEIDAELEGLREFMGKPAGSVRISAGEHPLKTILWPKLRALVTANPDIKLELRAESGMVDIVEERLDAGVRFGEALAKDMIAVRISPDIRMAVVATPEYFTHYPKPKTPQDLISHNCINVRLQTHGNLYAWDFGQDGHWLTMQVEGQLIFNSMADVLDALLEGYGIGMIFEDVIDSYVASGKLQRVLEDWCPPFTGYHLYYPHRLKASPAFAMVVEALRYTP